MPAGPSARPTRSSVLLGVGTRGYQVEGGYNAPGQPANNWVDWERSGRVEPSGTACSFWQEPEQVLDRAAGLGCDTFGLSVEWARIEPEEGEVDQHALDRYGWMLSMCAERRLEPVVTLHDFTHPWYLGEEFWMTPGSPERFATHARRAVRALSAHCRHWITINEPNALSIGGWIAGTHPPGRHGALSDASAVLDNLLTAHVLAYRAIKDEQPDAQVTTSIAASSVYDLDTRIVDLLCAPSMAVDRGSLGAWFEERRALHDFAEPPHSLGELLFRRTVAVASTDGHLGLGGIGRMLRRHRSPHRLLDVLFEQPDQRPIDAVGVGWHSTGAQQKTPAGTGNPRSSLELGVARAVLPGPDGLGPRVHERTAMVPGIPVWVIDHGSTHGDSAGASPDRTGDVPARAQSVRADLRSATVALIEGGVELYLYNRFIDGYEWGRYRPGRGLFGMSDGQDGRGATWLESDADSIDAADAFRDMITAVRGRSQRKGKGTR